MKKHMKKIVPTFENFLNEKKIPTSINVDGGSIEIGKKKITIYFYSDGWDNQRRWREEMEAFADGENDMLGEPVYMELEPYKIELDWENGFFDEDDESVTFPRLK